MKKLILLLTTTLILTSCYKNDYEDALDQIEQLEGQIVSKQNAINELIQQTELDAIHIADLTASLTDANNQISTLTTSNTLLSEEIALKTAQITSLLITIDELNTQLTDLRSELDDLLNQNDLQSSQITNMQNAIAALEDEIASFEPEIITLIEYVDRYHTVVVTETVIETVEVVVTETVTVTVVNIEQPEPQQSGLSINGIQKDQSNGRWGIEGDFGNLDLGAQYTLISGNNRITVTFAGPGAAAGRYWFSWGDNSNWVSIPSNSQVTITD